MQRSPGKKEPHKEEHKESSKDEKEQTTSSAITSMLKSLPPQSSTGKTTRFTNSVQISIEIHSIIEKLNANDQELKRLDLAKQSMTTEEKKQIFEALAKSTTVTTANFNNTDFGYIDALNFSQAFSANNNSTLKILLLNDNDIDAHTLEVILKTPLKLDKLVLRSNELRDEGAKLVAELATMPDVCLHENWITLEGVNHMLNSKKNFSALTYMTLKMGNPFGLYQPLEDKIAAIESMNNTNTTSSPTPKWIYLSASPLKIDNKF